ncbi:MAG TPA: sulfatase [Pirellulaceae bacterium]|nr:sulfatase [Pirellulaceae bacterium]
MEKRARRSHLLSRKHRSNTMKLAGTFCCLLAGIVCDARYNATAAERPNIVCILVDDLGYGDLSSYGADDLRSPNVDQLIKSGVRFDNFYANCPVCSPTRASLLTGRYPELVGVPGVIRTHPENSWGELARDAVLLPEVLKRAGYRTAIVGKWHLGLEAPNRPHDRGFDLFQGYLGDMMDNYYTHRRHEINYMRENDKEIDPPGHATDLFTEWSCDYLRAQRNSDAPFFLYLAYNAPHTPIQPPADWLGKVQQRESGITPKRAALVALIEHLDAGIGQVMETLRETGLARNTLIIFTSDNGGQSSAGANNGPLRDGKQSMYEGGLKVPFGAVWPGHITANTRRATIAITMDLFPTICAAAQVPFDHTIDGRSILPALQGHETTDTPRDLFFHRREGGSRYAGLTINAMRRGPWKLLQNSPFAPLEMYNLDDDPGEENDLAKEQRRKFQELSAALRVQVQRGGAVPWQPASRRDTP